MFLPFDCSFMREVGLQRETQAWELMKLLPYRKYHHGEATSKYSANGINRLRMAYNSDSEFQAIQNQEKAVE